MKLGEMPLKFHQRYGLEVDLTVPLKDLQQHLARNPQRAARFFCRVVDPEKTASGCSFCHQECGDYPLNRDGQGLETNTDPITRIAS